MNNNISYGPHLFPGWPELYIRKGQMDITIQEAHQRIKQTLITWFDHQQENNIMTQIAEKMKLDPESKIDLSFMNYGNTELVYLANIGDKAKFATLINQPHTPLGKVKEEFDNLKRMTEIDPHFVVKPLAHYLNKEKGHEVYISEYIDNAYCIAHNNEHGVYNPLPYYHFETFTKEISSEIHKIMIALLINYYDEEKSMWLAETQISGNDFLLSRDMQIKMIGARKYIKIWFDEYISRLKKEFIIGTNRTEWTIEKDMLINHKSKKPMTSEEIANGITLWLYLRKQQKKP